MKEKNRTYLFLILFLFFVRVVYSSPLETGNDRVGNPFLIFYNPSLICKQTGMPVGGNFLYNNNLGENSFILGFSETFSSSGVSLCYSNGEYEDINKISTAFSTFYKNLSFGSSFHFLFSSYEPVFTFDAGLSYHFKDKRYAGAVFRNIFLTDTLYSLAPEAVICAGGNIPWVDRLSFDFQAIVQLIDIKERELAYGGDLSIQKFFFKGPFLSVYTRGKVLYNTEDTLEWAVEPVLGFHHAFERFSFGIYSGYKVFYKEDKNKISLSFYVNPLNSKKKKDLSCEIHLSKTKLILDGDNDNILISINGVFSNKKVTVKRWNLLVTKEKNSKIDAVKTYSGGNIPPSSIVFDGRNVKGELLNSGTYYIQLILIDSLNRVVSSSYRKIEIK